LDLLFFWSAKRLSHPSAALLFSLVVVPALLVAQDTQTSPVFKSYKPPRPGAIVEQSDVTYQLWHTFDLTRRAGAGDVLAQQELAVRYLTGRGVKADTARGAFWTLSAAGQNMPPARFNLGILYSNGWGVQWNPFAAYEEFLWCAQRGMPESQYVLATILMENLVVPGNSNVAVLWLEAASDSGYVPARELLASMRRRGESTGRESGQPDVPASRDSARQQTQASTLPWSPVFLDFEADTGTSVDDGMLIADLLHESSSEELRALGLGDSVVRLEDAAPGALDAILHSAEAGSPEALALLGRCRERGIGLPADLVEAAVAYARSIRLGSPRAAELLLSMLDSPETMALIRSRATSGDPPASFVLASLVGLRLTHPLLKSRTWVTEEEAVRLLRRSATDGFVPASVELGVWYYSGRLVTRDRERAFELWMEAAGEGNQEAEIRLAVARLESGEPISDAQVRFFSEATGKGSVLAQMALGYCLERGLGVERNSGWAARLYRTAAQRGSQDAYRALLRMHDAIRPAGKEFEVREE
jgi:uncharacterized protein